MSSTAQDRRDWNWDSDGELEGLYVETREVIVKTGPSAGRPKLIFDFHVGLEDELVSAWETSVIRSTFREELRRRHAPDFEPGERIKISPRGKKEGANGSYRDFAIEFEHAAPKRSAAELLADPGAPDEEAAPAAPADSDIDF